MIGTLETDTREVTLTNTNEVALVDDGDYDLVVSYGDWYKSDTGYAVRRYKNSTLRMHRLIANPGHRLFVDHKNHNRLDNRRDNLRVVSQAENMQNFAGRKHVKHDLPSGVTFDVARNKYMATKKLRRRFETLDEALAWQKNKEDFEL